VVYNLLNGISINHLDLDIVKIEQLYIKLDKKLIFSAKTLQIDKEVDSSKSKNSLKELDYIFNNFESLLKLFKYISIERILFKNEEFSVLYENNLFFIDAKFVNLATFFNYKDKKLLFDIKSLWLKDYSILTNGVAILDINKDKDNFLYRGNFEIGKIEGKLEAIADESSANVKLKTNKFTNLEPVSRQLTFLDKEIFDWIFTRPEAKSYEVKYLTFDIKDYTLDLDSLKAIAKLDRVKLKFNDSLPPVKIDDLIVKFVNNDLTFNLKNSRYLGIDLDGSFVSIEDFDNLDETNLNILIKSSTRLDSKILNLLKYGYDIDIPIRQFNGFVDSAIKIKLNFMSEKLDVKALFKPVKSDFKLDTLGFKYRSGIIYLDNLNLKFSNLLFSHKDILKASLNAKLDLEKLKLNGKLDIKSFNIENGESSILNIRDIETPIYLSLKKVVDLSLEKLKIKFSSNKAINTIYIDDISKIYPYSELLQTLEISDGNTKIKTRDFKDFIIFSNLKNLDTPLYKYQNFIGNITLVTEISDKDVKVSSLDKDISIYLRDDNLNVNLFDYEIFLPDFDKFSKSKDSKKDENLKINVEAKNSNIFLGDKVILSDSFTFKSFKNKLFFSSKYKNTTLKVRKIKNEIDVLANNLDEVFFKSFFHQDKLEDGLYNLKLKGNIDTKLYNGKLEIQNVTVKNLKVLNNLVSFLDTIPAIVTLKKPGFSGKGYEVTDGYIDFRAFKDVVYIKKLVLNGDSIDIIGDGVIYLDKEFLDIRLEVSTVKNLSKIIKNIPIVGYIVLGDGRIATRVTIKGNFKNPTIETNLIRDTINAPINILQRTLSLPVKFFEFLSGSGSK